MIRNIIESLFYFLFSGGVEMLYGFHQENIDIVSIEPIKP